MDAAPLLNVLIKYWLPFIAINVVIPALLAPLLDGIERRVRARIQCRRGPPILQTWYDLVKLFRKGAVTGGPIIFRLAPYIAFTVSILTLSLIPTLLNASLSFLGDTIVFMYLLAVPSVIISIGSIYTGSPLASVGSCREVSLWMAYELVFALSVATLAIDRSSLLLRNILPPYPPLHPSTILAIAIIAFLTYAEGGRLPYEIPEAEPELAGGIVLEYGGAELGLVKYALLVKRITLSTLLIDLILPRTWLTSILRSKMWFLGIGQVVVSATYISLLVILSITYSAIEALYGRLRLDQALSVLKKSVIIAGVAVLAALMGY